MSVIKNTKSVDKPVSAKVDAKTTESTESKATVEAVVVGTTSADENIKALEAQNAELKNTVNELMSKIQVLLDDKAERETHDKIVAADMPAPKVEAVEHYDEPSANQQIKVMSMYYGTLNLCNSANRSAGKLLTFDKFGQVKSVLYHDLVDYVNNESKFAEQGLFYILDRAAVYSLGLSTEYNKLINKDIVDHITEYSDSDVRDIVGVMPNGQREALANVLADKLYAGVPLDRNKIAIISDVIGVDIQKKANDKKEFAERNMKK